MKNLEKAVEVYEEGDGHLGQVLFDVLQTFTIDPDAEYVEPAKPQPEAEYDAGWANDFWLAFLRANPGTHTALDERRVLAAEAARRERRRGSEDPRDIRWSAIARERAVC